MLLAVSEVSRVRIMETDREQKRREKSKMVFLYQFMTTQADHTVRPT